MCVIFFYVNANPAPGGYKLILASNRDEFYARATRAAEKWDRNGTVFGGIDLEPGREGGTWLAIGGQKGVIKVGALLNLTGEPTPRNAVGRGMLVSDFVASAEEQSSIENYNRALLKDCAKYSAFNFVSIEIGDRSTPARIRLCSNAPADLARYDEGKCYGFGNSLPAVPFEKVRYGRDEFEAIVENVLRQQELFENEVETAEQRRSDLVLRLQELLKSKQKFWPDVELKRRAPNWGEHLSALNVNIPDEGYGSRTHTVILVDGDNKMHFVEETMEGVVPEGPWHQTNIEKRFQTD